MAKHTLNIDSYIGEFGYSKQWLNAMLEGHDKDEVIINMSSLGGSVDHALAMHDRLKQHGNVTAILTGFNASAITIIAMGANKIRMSQNGMYLIHKALAWIDEFGRMNEDDIEALILRLEKEKNEAAKVTLLAAQMYSRHTAKSTQDILNLMKQETWLTAEEALENGFIHEIYTPAPDAQNITNDYSLAAMITTSGLPSPSPFEKGGQGGFKQQTPLQSQIITAIKEFFSQKSSKMKTQFTNINALLEVEKLEASDEGVFLNQEQLQKISQELTSKTQNITDLENKHKSELQAETDAKTQAIADKEQAEKSLNDKITEYQNLINNLNQIHETVANAEATDDKIKAIRTQLAKKPAAAPLLNLSKGDPTHTNDGVDWDTLMKLPHMKED